MSRPACFRCRDLGWVEEPHTETGFKPALRLAPCPDCNAGVVPMTRAEVIEFLLVFAALIGIVAMGAGS